MKKMLLFCVLSLFTAMAYAQTLTISNTSNCTVNYYLAASDPFCANSAQSISYAIAPGATVTWTFGSITWGSGAPGLGWQWSWIKEWNGCGPYSYGFPNCVGGFNNNVCVVGIPCTTFPFTSCMTMNNICNTCTFVKTQWFPLGGGNVGVRIW